MSLGIAGKYTPKLGGRYVDSTDRRPRESNMGDYGRSSGFLHGRNVTTGLDDRLEIAGSFMGSREAFRLLRRR